MLSFSEYSSLDEQTQLRITNGDVVKMMRKTKKEIEKLRRSNMKASEYDADHLEYSFMPALNAFNAKQIARSMNGGETETREIMFKIVSDVIGRDMAQDLSRF
jgi:hypothetical protein